MTFIERRLLKGVAAAARPMLSGYSLAPVDNAHSPDKLALRISGDNDSYDLFTSEGQWFLTAVRGPLSKGQNALMRVPIGVRDLALPTVVGQAVASALQAMKNNARTFGDLVSELSDVFRQVGIMVVEIEARESTGRLDALRISPPDLTPITFFVRNGRWVRGLDASGDEGSRDIGPFSFDFGDAMIRVATQILRRAGYEETFGGYIGELVGLLETAATASGPEGRRAASKALAENAGTVDRVRGR